MESCTEDVLTEELGEASLIECWRHCRDTIDRLRVAEALEETLAHLPKAPLLQVVDDRHVVHMLHHGWLGQVRCRAIQHGRTAQAPPLEGGRHVRGMEAAFLRLGSSGRFKLVATVDGLEAHVATLGDLSMLDAELGEGQVLHLLWVLLLRCNGHRLDAQEHRVIHQVVLSQEFAVKFDQLSQRAGVFAIKLHQAPLDIFTDLEIVYVLEDPTLCVHTFTPEEVFLELGFATDSRSFQIESHDRILLILKL